MDQKNSKNISYFDYLLNNLRFMSTNMFDSIPQTLGIIFFNFAGDDKLIGFLGFLISSYFFFFTLCFNHSEIINLKSGIHFNQKNFRAFTINIVQCVIINVFFYCICLALAFNAKTIFYTFGIRHASIDEISFYIPIFCLGVGTLFMITNILRRKLHVFTYFKEFWPVCNSNQFFRRSIWLLLLPALSSCTFLSLSWKCTLRDL